MTQVSLSFDPTGLFDHQSALRPLLLAAARASVQEVGRLVELQLESATASAGLGRLAKAWNSQVYPKDGLAEAPSARIFPKGKARTLGAIRAYSQGARIVGTRGQYLAIPLPAAGPKFVGRGKAPLTPAEWERRTGLKLRAVKIGGKLFLITDGVAGLRGGSGLKAPTNRRLAQGRKKETVAIFVLQKQVDVKQRFSIAAVTSGAANTLAADYATRANQAIRLTNG